MLGSGRAGGFTNWETVHTEEDIGHWGESLAEFYILSYTECVIMLKYICAENAFGRRSMQSLTNIVKI